MILRPHIEDLKTIGYYLGKIIIGLGLFMFLPIIIGIFFQELNPILDFSIGVLICLFVGGMLVFSCKTEKDLNWTQGMIVVSLSWVVAMALSAIPLLLSAHYGSYLDTCFEAMSGFTTSGLTLVQNLDHLSYAHNFWRHFMMFLGGQGVVVISLGFLVKGYSGAFKMYAGEGRDEKILPNVISTSRFIWLVSLTYLAIGTLVLGFIGFLNGIPLSNALFHGMSVFMAAFSTGGFAPQSQNILYYHSLPYEIATMVFLTVGALNFNLHYAVWRMKKKEIVSNLETRTFFITIMLTFILLAAGLGRLGIYPNAMILFRKGFFNLLSGHTTTGFSTVYAQQFITEWGGFALLILTIAMALGACACSTGGGIKALRIGMLFKAMVNDVKRIMLPESAVFVEKYHHIKDIILEDRQVRSAAMITLCYIGLYFIGAIAGMLLGYPVLSSLFESTSAASNSGLSCGITQASMPAVLKLVYIFQMWAGRLEFISAFALIGFVIAWVRGK